MDHIQNIELQDMMAIIHGLRMSGLGFVEPDALDAINSRIKDLPSSEDLGKMYSDPREAQRITGEVGRIMELIDYYGTRNEESKTRYRAKTKLPPRYKNLKWKKAMKRFRLTKVSYELPDASNEVEAIVQRTKDVQNSLITTKQGVEQFVERLNTDIPEVMRFVPQQYQKSILQHQAIMNDAANQVGQTIQILMNDAESIGEAATNAGRISQQTEESVDMYSNMGNEMGNLATSKTYLKNIVKLSSNLEGNGIISQKLLTYAKNVKNNDPQARYDAREIAKLLSLSSLNREANTFIKTAGLADLAKGIGNMWSGGGQQQVPDGYVQIDPGEQTGPQWATGDDETQFTNDLNWLERSWDNLVGFCHRYLRDASTLSKEWQGKNAPEKVKKIEELKSQANVLFENAKKMQGAANFTAALTGDKFEKAFGNTGETGPAGPEGVSEKSPKELAVDQQYKGTGTDRTRVYTIVNFDDKVVNCSVTAGGNPDGDQLFTLADFTEFITAGTLIYVPPAEGEPPAPAEGEPPAPAEGEPPVTAEDVFKDLRADKTKTGASLSEEKLTKLIQVLNEWKSNKSGATASRLSRKVHSGHVYNNRRMKLAAHLPDEKVNARELQLKVNRLLQGETYVDVADIDFLLNHFTNLLNSKKTERETAAAKVNLTPEKIEHFRKAFEAAKTTGKKSGYPLIGNLSKLRNLLNDIKNAHITSATSLGHFIKEAAGEQDFPIEALNRLSNGEWTIDNVNAAIVEVEEMIRLQQAANAEDKAKKAPAKKAPPKTPAAKKVPPAAAPATPPPAEEPLTELPPPPPQIANAYNHRRYVKALRTSK